MHTRQEVLLSHYKQVFLRQLTTWHCPHSAPHAAAEARLLLGTGRAAIDRHLLPAGPTAANPQQRRAAAEWDRRTNGDRQTDGRTPDRYTDPASYTIRVVPINKLMIQLSSLRAILNTTTKFACLFLFFCWQQATNIHCVCKTTVTQHTITSTYINRFL